MREITKAVKKYDASAHRKRAPLPCPPLSFDAAAPAAAAVDAVFEFCAWGLGN